MSFSSRWQLVEVITENLADCPEEQETWRKSVTVAAFKCLIASYSHSKDQATPPSEQEQNILERLQRLLVGLLSSFILYNRGFMHFMILSSLHRHQQMTSLQLNGTVLSRMD